MKCPYCGFEDLKVIDSRPAEDKTRRRRECTRCGERFTTYEAVEVPLLMVEKRDGSVQLFDKSKLINGIVSAIKKRPVSAEKVTEIANYVENYYANALRTVAKSSEIGELVLDRLRDIDPISYIRFASVYKDFTDIDSFVAAISEFNDNGERSGNDPEK
ncbi:transcriptional repressor NrdR [Ruminococcus flavefaciens]|uniref:Transcriptional repressor NrdR n=1 Tax=Ruminococcus flavefaciens TaxID=1265 RepID=A0A1H6IU36_RUMFL|nr:transcriptional regulator NrdR [Ruminococcus flavefaciens]SEH51533.1 transcriptional repressor NrdR [Ruminococcus flavefaciens]